MRFIKIVSATRCPPFSCSLMSCSYSGELFPVRTLCPFYKITHFTCTMSSARFNFVVLYKGRQRTKTQILLGHSLHVVSCGACCLLYKPSVNNGIICLMVLQFFLIDFFVLDDCPDFYVTTIIIIPSGFL